MPVQRLVCDDKGENRKDFHQAYSIDSGVRWGITRSLRLSLFLSRSGCPHGRACLGRPGSHRALQEVHSVARLNTLLQAPSSFSHAQAL